MPRKRLLPPLPDTSSLNDYFVCDYCHGKFRKKPLLYRHIQKCAKPKNATKYSLEKWRQMLMCKHCNVVYGNKKLLSNHIDKYHPEDSNTNNEGNEKKEIDQPQPEVLPILPNTRVKKCEVCNRMFPNVKILRFHRRKEHFNLIAKIPYCDMKKVNQIWFEKVMNCNNIVEIRKTAPNTLVMRKMDENTAIKVYEHNTKIIDLSDIYPISS